MERTPRLPGPSCAGRNRIEQCRRCARAGRRSRFSGRLLRFGFGSWRHARTTHRALIRDSASIPSPSRRSDGRRSRTATGSAVWSGPGGEIVSEVFSPIPPDLPSLEETELEPRFGVCDRSASTEEGEPPLLIEFGVRHAVPLPVVRAVIRIPVGGGLAFPGLVDPAPRIVQLGHQDSRVPDGPVNGSPRGTCSRPLAEGARPTRTASTRLDDFDPYDVRWDGRFDDPLSGVRTRLGEIESTIAFGPELEGQPPF